MSSDHHSYSPLKEDTIPSHGRDNLDIKTEQINDDPQSRQPFIESITPIVESETEGSILDKESQNEVFVKRIWSGWQRGMTLACTFSLATAIINISLYFWARTKPTSLQGTYILFESDNDTTKRAEVWIHLVINILSTILLAGSNYTLQVLQSSTRQTMDLAHSQDKSLCVGASSFKNWTFMCRRRKVLYMSMVILMLPLHLLYNSVIFSTVSTFDPESASALVTKDFQQLQPPDNSSYRHIWDSTHNDKWTAMDVQDCEDSIAKHKILSQYSNVLLITNITGAQQNSSYYYLLNSTLLPDDTPGTYGPGYDTLSPMIFEWPNTYLQSDALQSWSSEVYSPFWDGFLVPLRYLESYGPNFTLVPAHVESCLLEQANISTIELLPQILIIVIVCNILKVIILILSIRLDFQPMVTIGDAITSFLDDPDQTTSGLAPLSVDVFREGHRATYRPWKVQNRRYLHGVSRFRWVLTMSLCLCFLAALITAVSETVLADGWLSWDVEPDYHNPFPVGATLFATIIVANIPQLGLSIIYVYYNALFTFMLVSSEFVAYSFNRKSLRVSKPEGEQRSTYFLSLPWKYSIPLGAGSMLLHWLLSQGFYVVEINLYAANGSPEPNSVYGLLGITCAPLPLVVEIIVFGIMMMIPVLFGLRRFKSAIPFVGTDSMAISAACHTTHTVERLSIQKIQYGVICGLPSGTHRIGFSNEQVTPLIPGEFYE